MRKDRCSKDVGKIPRDFDLPSGVHESTRRTVPEGEMSESEEFDNGLSARTEVVAVDFEQHHDFLLREIVIEHAASYSAGRGSARRRGYLLHSSDLGSRSEF